MKVTRTGSREFTVEFESEAELLEEHRTNLAMGGLRLVTGEKLPLHSTLSVTLRAGGAGAVVPARVVAPLPDGVALAIEANADELLESLLAEPAEEAEGAGAEVGAEAPERDQSLWDRVRGLSRMEKILLAAKAERSERALLLQDNDPQVLYSLLKNPRLTVDEVVRVAKSSFLTYQTAELIMKTGLWFANVDVRVALIHNNKTPVPFALRILPTLPESEVRTISRGAATSMALKQAALRKLQSGT